jgi:hypothetical protein
MFFRIEKQWGTPIKRMCVANIRRVQYISHSSGKYHTHFRDFPWSVSHCYSSISGNIFLCQVNKNMYLIYQDLGLIRGLIWKSFHVLLASKRLPLFIQTPTLFVSFKKGINTEISWQPRTREHYRHFHSYVAVVWSKKECKNKQINK